MRPEGLNQLEPLSMSEQVDLPRVGRLAATLPIEVVEQILRLSSFRPGPASSSSTTSGQRSLRRGHFSYPVRDSHQLAQLCLLSRSLNQTFTPELYHSVELLHLGALDAFKTTVIENERLGQHVRHLAIMRTPDLGASSTSPADALRRHEQRQQARVGAPLETPDLGQQPALATQHLSPTTLGPPADRILALCPNVTHLLLSRSFFYDWSRGLYRMASLREIGLIDVVRASDFDGLVSRHREAMTAALQNDPRMQSILNPGASVSVPSPMGTAATGAGAVQDEASTTQSSASHPSVTNAPQRLNIPVNLTHLHLVNFDGRLIHHLAQLTSLTHLVFTNPLVPELAPGAPGLAVIPRSHLLLLLGSGRIRKIIIRAEATNCLRILEEVMPIDDQKLIFRPIQTRINDAGSALASDTSQSSSSSRSTGAAREADILGEWWQRVHRDSDGTGRPRTSSRSTSSREQDSFDSSEMEGDSSWSDDRGPASSGGGSGGNTSGSYYDSDEYISSDEDMENRSDNRSGARSAGHTNAGSTATEAGPSTMPLLPSGLATGMAERGPAPAPAAPPLQTPIETLLQYETGLPRTAWGASLASADRASTHLALPTQSQQVRPRRQGPHSRGLYSSRRSDVRGATNAGSERLLELIEAEHDPATLGTAMAFW